MLFPWHQADLVDLVSCLLSGRHPADLLSALSGDIRDVTGPLLADLLLIYLVRQGAQQSPIGTAILEWVSTAMDSTIHLTALEFFWKNEILKNKFGQLKTWNIFEKIKHFWKKNKKFEWKEKYYEVENPSGKCDQVSHGSLKFSESAKNELYFRDIWKLVEVHFLWLWSPWKK